MIDGGPDPDGDGEHDDRPGEMLSVWMMVDRSRIVVEGVVMCRSGVLIHLVMDNRVMVE